jgi:glutathione peroxidase
MTQYLADFHATTIDGKDQDLGEYAGEVVLVVNTASECGYTPQYEGLQQLYDDYRDRGFTVLGFPCNQFGGQEPGSEEEIAAFCEGSYHVSFPMFAKVDVNGDDSHPLYRWLTEERGGPIEWNFTKFLIGRDGALVDRFGTRTEPAELVGDIRRALDAPDPSDAGA